MTRSNSRTMRAIAYGSVVALLVSGTTTAALLFFQATEHVGHAHSGLTGWEATLAPIVDSSGLVAILPLATEFAEDYAARREAMEKVVRGLHADGVEAVVVPLQAP